MTRDKLLRPQKAEMPRVTFGEVYTIYCENGRSGKAYATIKKQDSLWRNHLEPHFSKRYIDEISVAEVNDYLTELYYTEGRAYRYVEGFLKMFYLKPGPPPEIQIPGGGHLLCTMLPHGRT